MTMTRGSTIARSTWVAMAIIVVAGADVPSADGHARHASQISMPGGQPATGIETGIYWCPMHPDVRRDRAGVCPRCSMTLVAVRADDTGAGTLDVDIVPRAFKSGQAVRIAIVARSPRDERIGAFEVIHERPFHLFIVSDDLEVFAHEHPVPDCDGTLSLDWTFPRPGFYRLVADFVPAGAAPQLLGRVVATSDTTRSIDAGIPAPAVDLAAKVAGSTTVAFDATGATAGQPSRLVLRFTDTTTGLPVKDLEPWLGAAAHVVVARPGLTDVSHLHPADQNDGLVALDALFPVAGVYRLWAQFQRGGIVQTVSFTLRVDAAW